MNKYKIEPENYFSYGDSSMIETTFFSELNKKNQIYGLISYFSDNKKNIAKLITPQKRLEFTVKSKNYKENIALQLVSTKSENVISKKIENKMNNFGILSENKTKRIGEKRRMSRILDEVLISGLEDLKQYPKLNPVDIKVDDSQIISSLSKCWKYRLKIMSLLISASFNQTANVIFITYIGLNDAKKALINLTEEANFDLIKSSSKWLNIIFSESNREAKHFNFEIVSNSLHDILSFSYSMLDIKGNLLTFPADEEKVTVLNFTIQVIR